MDIAVYRHHQCTVSVLASPDELFQYTDDHRRLSSHMSQPSWMLGNGTMSIETDSDNGKRVGSGLTLSGIVFGLKLQVRERVKEITPSHSKTWETEGEPSLLVIGPYEMGFDIQTQGRASLMTVFINYSWPEGIVGMALGFLFARMYAAWCTARMTRDAAAHFKPPAAQHTAA